MKIRITSVPAGDAPLAIREQWVGVEIPVYGVEDHGIAVMPFGEDGLAGVITGPQRSVVSGLPVDPDDNPHLAGFRVETEVAIAALREAGKKEAADWWQQCFENHPDSDILVFGQQFCEIVE